MPEGYHVSRAIMPLIHAPARNRAGVFFCLLLIVAILISGCTRFGEIGESGSVAECLGQLETPASPTTGVFVEPDDGYPPVLDEFEHARCTIDLTIYMLTDDTVFAALIGAVTRGVRVRVILDEHPFGMFGSQEEAMERLQEGGVEVLWSPSTFQFTHAKYAVIDHRVALIMNQNLTFSAFNGNREFGVITTEPDAVNQAASIFEHDWTGDTSARTTGPLIISPDSSRTRISSLIGEAQVSIDFYAEVIRDDEIIAALGDAVDRGVQVRLIVNSNVDPDNELALAELSLIGVQVRMMDIMYIHSKTMIIDGSAALIGSQNYTMTSLDRNREVGMVVDDPALVLRVIAIYERDWSRAVPAHVVPTSSLRVGITMAVPRPSIWWREGERTIPGHVRTWQDDVPSSGHSNQLSVE